MRKERKHFTPEEKVAILRRHPVDKVPVSELCEELGLRPTMFCARRDLACRMQQCRCLFRRSYYA
jgi:transposase-like protein